MPKKYFHSKMQEITLHKDELEKNKATVATLKEEARLAEAALTLALKQKNEVAEKNQDLRIQNDKVQQQFKDLAAKKKNKSTKYEQMSDVKEEITLQIKNIFRTIKFAQAGQELVLATERMWKNVNGRLRLDQPPHNLNAEEFTRIYASFTQTNLSLARQYVQSRSQEAAYGKHNFGPLYA